MRETERAAEIFIICVVFVWIWPDGNIVSMLCTKERTFLCYVDTKGNNIYLLS